LERRGGLHSGIGAMLSMFPVWSPEQDGKMAASKDGVKRLFGQEGHAHHVGAR